MSEDNSGHEPNIVQLLRAAVESAHPVVHGIPDDQLAKPTPCSDYDVRGLLNHLLQAIVAFQKIPEGEQLDLGDQDMLTGDWRASFDTETALLIEAWQQPGALDGTSPLGLPQTVTVQMVVVDLAVHAWDLARATGQAVRHDAELVDTLYQTLQQLAPTGREMGAFGPEVQVSPEAPVLDRLLGVAGRDPSWQPTS